MEEFTIDFRVNDETLYTATAIAYGENGFYVQTTFRKEYIFPSKSDPDRTIWKTNEGVTDDWIQAAGEAIEAYHQ